MGFGVSRRCHAKDLELGRFASSGSACNWLGCRLQILMRMPGAMEKQRSSSLIASPVVTGLSMVTLGETCLLSHQYGCCRMTVVISQDTGYDLTNWKGWPANTCYCTWRSCWAKDMLRKTLWNLALLILQGLAEEQCFSSMKVLWWTASKFKEWSIKNPCKASIDMTGKAYEEENKKILLKRISR